MRKILIPPHPLLSTHKYMSGPQSFSLTFAECFPAGSPTDLCTPHRWGGVSSGAKVLCHLDRHSQGCSYAHICTYTFAITHTEKHLELVTGLRGRAECVHACEYKCGAWGILGCRLFIATGCCSNLQIWNKRNEHTHIMHTIFLDCTNNLQRLKGLWHAIIRR